MTVSAADPDDLAAFVVRTRTARLVAVDEQRSLTGLQRSVATGSTGYGAHVPALDSLRALLDGLDGTERFVHAVRRELQAADGSAVGGRIVLPDSRLGAALDRAGVGSPPDQVRFVAATLHGLPPTSGFVDDPVCAANGNMVHQDLDLRFPGLAATLDVRRTYNSLLTGRVGAHGPGYTSILDVRLVAAPGRVEVDLPDGATVRFLRTDAGWAAFGRRVLDLDHTDEGYTVRTGRRDGFRFDTDGRLTGWWDGPTSVTVERDADGRIVAVADALTGRGYVVRWSSGRVRRIETSDGRAVDYAYAATDDGSTRLVRATTECGHLETEWSGGLLVAVVDADGVRPFVNTYDGAGRVATQRSPFGRVTTYRYDPSGLTVVTGDDGTRQAMTHDARGNLTSVIDADGSAMRIRYDHADRATHVVSRGGAEWRYRFDEGTGGLAGRIDPDGFGMRWTYDAAGRVTAVTGRNGATTRLEYDTDASTPSRIVDPAGATTSIEVDRRLDLPIAVTDPDGVVTRFEYDPDGQVLAEIDALGHRTTFEYDAAGRLVASVDLRGLRTAVTYDHGRAVAVDRGGTTTTFARTPAGRIAASTLPDGAAWRAEFGDHGEPVAVVDHDGATTRLGWDRMGNLVSVGDPAGRELHRVLDEVGRLVGIVTSAGASWHYRYDVDDHLVEAVDAAGRRSRREVDASGRTTRFVAADGGETTYTYHPGGQVATIVLPDGTRWCTEVDHAGRTVAVDGPNGRAEVVHTAGGRVRTRRFADGTDEVVHHDAAGRLAAVVDATGRRNEIERDAAGALLRTTGITLERDTRGRVTRCVSQGRDDVFAYDASDHLVRRTDATGRSAHFTWGPGGLLATATDPAGGRTEYGYDPLGRLASVTAPGGRTTSYGYGDHGLVESIVDPVGVTTSLEHDPTGLLVRLRRGDDGWHRVLDAAGRTARIETLGGDPLASYEYDLVGRLRVATTPRHRLDLGRDPQGAPGPRLPQPGPIVAASGASTLRSFDAAGRLLLGADGTAYEYDVGGRLLAIEPVEGEPIRFEYSSDGLVAAEGGRHRTRRFGYDAAGRVTTVDEAGRGTTTIGYDAAGRRSSERRPDGSTVRYEWNALDQLVRVLRTSASGAIVEVPIEYDALGRPVAVGGRPVGDGAVRVGTLTVLGARVHDAITHQFLTSDPLLAAPGANGGASAYTYAWHDPVNVVDPSGLRPISMEEWEVLRTREEQGTLGAAADAIRADPFGSLLAAGVVAAGVVMLATPAAAIGMGVLVGAGLTAGIGVATGAFDPRSVAIGGVIGGCSVGAANALTPARQVAADTLAGAAESGLRQLDDGQFDPTGFLVGAASSSTASLVGVRLGPLATTSTQAFVVDGSVGVADSVVAQGLTGGGWSVGGDNWADGALGGSLGVVSHRMAPSARAAAPHVPNPPEPVLRLEAGPVAPAAGPTPEMSTVSRAVSAGERAVHAETGLVLPDVTRRAADGSVGAHAGDPSSVPAPRDRGEETELSGANRLVGDEVDIARGGDAWRRPRSTP